jgi:hypothetical protein
MSAAFWRRVTRGFGHRSRHGGPDGLAALLRAIIAFYRRHADLLGAITEIAAYDPAVAAFLNSELDRFTDRTAELIRPEQDAGRTAADIDPVSPGDDLGREPGDCPPCRERRGEP